jgi:hypothetical protein
MISVTCIDGWQTISPAQNFHNADVAAYTVRNADGEHAASSAIDMTMLQFLGFVYNLTTFCMLLTNLLF